MAKRKSDDEKDEGPELRREGRRTREGMVDAIKKGGSVLYKGEIITREEELPDEAEITEGDAEAAEAALAGLDAHMAALAGQRAALERSAKGGTAKAAPTTAAHGHAAEKPKEHDRR